MYILNIYDCYYIYLYVITYIIKTVIILDIKTYEINISAVIIQTRLKTNIYCTI